MDRLQHTGAILDDMDAAALRREAAAPRHLALDERGVGLRATWHFERGFVNLSLWRDDRCVETFHLTPAEAARLVGFLVDGLAGAVPEPAVRAVPPLPTVPEPPPGRLAEVLGRLRSRRRRLG
jgi:hypothetical protein